MPDLTQVTPPKELDSREQDIIFQHIFRRLAAHRNTRVLYAEAEASLSKNGEGLETQISSKEYEKEIDQWANSFLKNVWAACDGQGGMFTTHDRIRPGIRMKSQSVHHWITLVTRQ